MFNYFENCSSNPHQFYCENSLTKSKRYNLFSFRWPCSSLKMTTVSQTWQMLNLYCKYNTNTNSWPYLGQYLSYGIQSWHVGRLMHGIYKCQASKLSADKTCLIYIDIIQSHARTCQPAPSTRPTPAKAASQTTWGQQNKPKLAHSRTFVYLHSFFAYLPSDCGIHFPQTLPL